MKLYFVRHGQTLFNQLKRVQGWSDAPLTNLGIQQAQDLGIGLKDISFAHAYSSSSERAYDTAAYVIGDRNIDITPLKGLREMFFGNIEGGHGQGVFDQGIDLFDLHFEEYGGETLEQASTRFYNTVYSIVLKHQESDNILIVSHGAIIMSFIRKVDRDRFIAYHAKHRGIDNCSVTLVDFNHGQFKVESISDTHYRS